MSKWKTEWKYHDGGRLNAGLGSTAIGDCATRAITIATEGDYETVYHDLFELTRTMTEKSRAKWAVKSRKRGPSPRDGVFKEVYTRYLTDLGWEWTPTMHIGSGCTTHLRKDELPIGRVIARCSKHLVAVIDGVCYDTSDPSRGGSRCVYGYWQDSNQTKEK